MSNEPYVCAKFKVWAVITTSDGKDIVFDDVISVSSTFALNSVPTASMVVAVGTDYVRNRMATIHSAKSKLAPRDKIVVWLRITHGAGDETKMPGGTYKIFDGFVVGIGYQRAHNQANYVLHLTHWLDDLNNSSAINGNWFPSVPFDYAQTATYSRLGEVSSFAPNPTVAEDIATRDNVQDDLWEKVIKQLFIQLAGYGGGLIQEARNQANPTEKNDAAVRALLRMPGDGASYYKKLSLKLTAAGGDNVSNSFTKYFTSTIGTSFVQNTFWAKLVSDYAAQFFFAISPAVDWALPIPFCAGVRWQPGGKVIHADEYNYANLNANMSQLIQSVDIAYASTDRSGLSQGAINNDPNGLEPKRVYYYPCGSYPPPPRPPLKPRSGLRLFKLPPDWAANTDAATLTALATSMDSASTTDPAAPAGTTLPANVTPSADAAEAMRVPINLFAQHWFVTEVLQQRYGELSGPLRFDIAPGSIVKIETPTRDVEFESAGTDPIEYVVASVMSVSYVINAERATASTALAIAHTKIESELAPGSVYAVNTPPLYKEAWPGGPLSEPIT